MTQTAHFSERQSMNREKVRFPSGRTECAAWHYPGSNGGCVIMAGGFGVPKEPGTDRFAQRFNDAGFAVLAFDYRNTGESGGEPRQVLRIKDQLADWRAALAFAPTLPDVEEGKIAIWGFSLSGGHVLEVAADSPRIAAAIAQTPNADGKAASRNAMRYQTRSGMLRLTGRAMLDLVGGLLRRPPRLVPLAGERGTVALLTTPDARDGDKALDAAAYPEWQQAVAARSTLGVAFYRPGRVASKIRCPLLVVAADQDQSALVEPAVTAATHAPNGELLRIPGGHYAPFLDGFDLVVDRELAFLRRHLLEP